VLEEIAAMSPDGGSELLREVIGAFCEDTPKALAALAIAARGADAGQVRDLAHRLKSSFANVGALDASKRCATLCTGTAQPGAAAAAQRLCDDFPELERALLSFLERRKSQPPP